MANILVRTSKFISLVLRHRPDLIGLALDEHGWADVDALIEGANRLGRPLDRALLEQVVRENDKQRFTLSQNGQKIRANQGHSVAVDLELKPRQPPDMLYHGTVRAVLDSIMQQGLIKGRRHAVHLSADVGTAKKVGTRRGASLVLKVDAARMAVDGFMFTCSANGVWLVDSVLPKYLAVLE